MRNAFRVGAVASLMLGAFTAGASAANPRLWLIEGSKKARAVPGENAVGELTVGHCVSGRIQVVGDKFPGPVGSVSTNGAPTDTLRFPAQNGYDSCEEGGYALRGNLTKWTLTGKGTAKLTASPKMVYGEPGWCAYDISKLQGSFSTTLDARIDITGSVTAKLDKSASLGEECPATQLLGFSAEPFSDPGAGAYLAETEG